jgi:alkylhydroperoxidase family enzyme
MCEYVDQLSRDATELGPENLDILRGHGFDDRAILQITLIASWFNYVNRVADALGVGRGSGVELQAPRLKEPVKADE